MRTLYLAPTDYAARAMRDRGLLAEWVDSARPSSAAAQHWHEGLDALVLITAPTTPPEISISLAALYEAATRKPVFIVQLVPGQLDVFCTWAAEKGGGA